MFCFRKAWQLHLSKCQDARSQAAMGQAAPWENRSEQDPWTQGRKEGRKKSVPSIAPTEMLKLQHLWPVLKRQPVFERTNTCISISCVGVQAQHLQEQCRLVRVSQQLTYINFAFDFHVIILRPQIGIHKLMAKLSLFYFLLIGIGRWYCGCSGYFFINFSVHPGLV